MPVFRVEKNSNYTTMCNYHLRDQGLSLKGKGLLSMLLSLPDTWNYSVRGLSSITPDGVDGVLTALKELERLGYLERNQQRESNGRMGRAEYVIYAVLIQNLSFSDNIISSIWGVLGYTVLLAFTLFKTGSLAKSVFAAH